MARSYMHADLRNIFKRARRPTTRYNDTVELSVFFAEKLRRYSCRTCDYNNG